MFRMFLFSILLVALTACSNQTPPKSAEAPQGAQPAAPLAVPAASAAPAAPTATSPAPAGTLATQDSTTAGLAADFTECKRKEGVLSVKVRFRNTSPAEAHIYVINQRNFDAFYVTAANKKYFMPKDSEGAYLTPATDGTGTLSVSVDKGGQRSRS